jgi:predicted TIM-barrel fold metal-dependent hydrolase
MNLPPIIDCHALLGREDHLELDADELLRRMDLHGIEIAIARPMGAELIVRNREGNDRVLTSHKRIRGLVSVNPWWGGDGVEELRRCRDLGAVGLYLSPARQGFFPTDPLIVPLLELAEGFGWPVMFQTGAFVYADLLAVVEVTRQFSGIDFIAGFGGFADMWFELPSVFDETRNLYLDTSMMWAEAIRGTFEGHGPGRVLYGSAEPRNRYAVSLANFRRLELDQDVVQTVMCDNARRVFRLS